jgi:hypothetical protein
VSSKTSRLDDLHQVAGDQAHNERRTDNTTRRKRWGCQMEWESISKKGRESCGALKSKSTGVPFASCSRVAVPGEKQKNVRLIRSAGSEEV